VVVRFGAFFFFLVVVFSFFIFCLFSVCCFGVWFSGVLFFLGFFFWLWVCYGGAVVFVLFFVVVCFYCGLDLFVVCLFCWLVFFMMCLCWLLCGERLFWAMVSFGWWQFVWLDWGLVSFVVALFLY